MATLTVVSEAGCCVVLESCKQKAGMRLYDAVRARSLEGGNMVRFICVSIAAASLAMTSAVATAAERIRLMRLESTMLGAGDAVSLVVRAAPPFYAHRANRTGFGSFLGQNPRKDAEIGSGIVRVNRVDDPAVRIGESLARALSNRFGLILVRERSGQASPLEGFTPAARRVELQVRTDGWGFRGFVLDWNNFRVQYSATVRLVDSGSGKTLAEGHCIRDPETMTPDAPSYEQLLANDAARLKADLAKYADQCAGEFAINVFGMTSNPAGNQVSK